MKLACLAAHLVILLAILGSVSPQSPGDTGLNANQKHKVEYDEEKPDPEENDAFNSVLAAMMTAENEHNEPVPEKPVPVPEAIPEPLPKPVAKPKPSPPKIADQEFLDLIADDEMVNFDYNVSDINKQLYEAEKEAEITILTPEMLDTLEEQEDNLADEAAEIQDDSGLSDSEIEDLNKNGLPVIKLDLPEPIVRKKKPSCIDGKKGKEYLIYPSNDDFSLMDIDGQLTLPYLNINELNEIIDTENKIIGEEKNPLIDPEADEIEEGPGQNPVGPPTQQPEQDKDENPESPSEQPTGDDTLPPQDTTEASDEDEENQCEPSKRDPNYFNEKINAALASLANNSEKMKESTHKNDNTINQFVKEWTSTVFGIDKNASSHGVASKLAHLAVMYQEHKEFMTGKHIADRNHFGHLKHFTDNMRCLMTECDFNAHRSLIKNLDEIENEEDPSDYNNPNVFYSQEEGDRISRIRGAFRNIAEHLNKIFGVKAKASLDEKVQLIDDYKNAVDDNAATRRLEHDIPTGLYSGIAHKVSRSVDQRRFLEEDGVKANIQNSSNDENDDTLVKDEELENQTLVIFPAPSADIQNEKATDVQRTDDSLESLEMMESVMDNTLQQLSTVLPKCITNKDIEVVSGAFIKNASDVLLIKDEQADSAGKSAAQSVDNVKSVIQSAKNLKPDEFKQLLGQVEAILNQQIDHELSKESLGSNSQSLKQLADKINQAKSQLDSSLPVEGIADIQINDLVSKFNNDESLDEFRKMTPEELQAARDEAKAELKTQIDNVDNDKAAKSINTVTDNFDEILNGKLVKSLTAENISWILHRTVQGALKDLESLKSENKASKFVLDVKDIDYLASNVSNELVKTRRERKELIKQLKEAQSKQKLQDTDQSVLEQPNESESKEQSEISQETSPASCRRPLDKLIDNLEAQENVFETLISDESVKSAINDSIVGYWNGLISYTSQLEPLVKNSQTIKALTKDIDNPNLSQPQRLLAHMILLHANHSDNLNNDDHMFVDFIQRLLLEYNNNNDSAKFEHMLDSVIEALKGQRSLSSLKLNISKVDISHLVSMQNPLAEFTKGFTNLKKNLSNTHTSAKKLEATISQGEATLKSVTDVFKLPANLLSPDNSSTGTLSKIKSLFLRRLEEPRNLAFDSIGSFKTIYNNLKNSRAQAKELAANYEAANQNAEKFRQLFSKVVALKGL